MIQIYDATPNNPFVGIHACIILCEHYRIYYCISHRILEFDKMWIFDNESQICKMQIKEPFQNLTFGFSFLISSDLWWVLKSNRICMLYNNWCNAYSCLKDRSHVECGKFYFFITFFMNSCDLWWPLGLKFYNLWYSELSNNYICIEFDHWVHFQILTFFHLIWPHMSHNILRGQNDMAYDAQGYHINL